PPPGATPLGPFPNRRTPREGTQCFWCCRPIALSRRGLLCVAPGGGSARAPARAAGAAALLESRLRPGMKPRAVTGHYAKVPVEPADFFRAQPVRAVRVPMGARVAPAPGHR